MEGLRDFGCCPITERKLLNVFELTKSLNSLVCRKIALSMRLKGEARWRSRGKMAAMMREF